MHRVDPVSAISPETELTNASDLPEPGSKGPAFWEEWRGRVPDEEIDFIRVIFEEFCGSWE